MHVELLAEVALAAHLAWILWLAAGMPLGVSLSWPRLRLLHGASVSAQLAIQLSGSGCPMSMLEHWLQGGSLPPDGSLLVVWLERLVYPPLPASLIVAASALWSTLTIATLVLWPPRPVAREAA